MVLALECKSAINRIQIRGISTAEKVTERPVRAPQVVIPSMANIKRAFRLVVRVETNFTNHNVAALWRGMSSSV